MRPLNQRGQFIPITGMVIFTSVVMLYAVLNIYRVSRAKLEAQNLADATALAIAAMEAKSINTVIDRNEWLNHMYSDEALQNQGKNPHMLPGISMAAQGKGKGMPAEEAQNYAQLIYTINRAQMMFSQAYNNFMGAAADSGGSGVQSMNSGLGSLAEILSEIHGLFAPDVVQVIVFNNDSDSLAADDQAKRFTNTQNQSGVVGAQLQAAGVMKPVEYETEDVTINVDKTGPETLTKLLGLSGQDATQKVGWMHPKWDSKASFTIKTADGKTQSQIGAGAIVIKQVLLPYFKTKPFYVQAKSIAYVVRQSGLSMGAGGVTNQPPDHFRPTYYVQLGVK